MQEGLANAIGGGAFAGDEGSRVGEFVGLGDIAAEAGFGEIGVRAGEVPGGGAEVVFAGQEILRLIEMIVRGEGLWPVEDRQVKAARETEAEFDIVVAVQVWACEKAPHFTDLREICGEVEAEAVTETPVAIGIVRLAVHGVVEENERGRADKAIEKRFGLAAAEG